MSGGVVVNPFTPSSHTIIRSPSQGGKEVRRLLCVFLSLALFAVSACSSSPKPVVVMETSMGTIKIELDEGRAPITVKNFLHYVDDKFYDGTIFHRVIPDFMIQGGGFTPDMKEKPTGPPIKNEGGNGLNNDRGTIAMARTPDPDSATAQFYINVKNNRALNRSEAADKMGYTVFGKVIEGMDVVDRIDAVQTKAVKVPGIPVPMEDVPAEPVLIKSVRRAENKK
jgi:cyclophilin family peptidyl-prolyl cis-trans isomerase